MKVSICKGDQIYLKFTTKYINNELFVIPIHVTKVQLHAYITSFKEYYSEAIGTEHS